MNNYHFLLFTVEHGIEIYPLTIYVDESLGKELDAEAKTVKRMTPMIMAEALGMNGNKKEPIRHFIISSSEDEFMNTLKRILGSQRSLQVIGSLLSLVNASEEQPLSRLTP